MSSKRILIISYRYPPEQSPRAVRWSAIAEFWANRGYEVHVVCAGMSCENEIRNGVFVHRAGEGLLGWTRRQLVKASGNRNTQLVRSPSGACRLRAPASGAVRRVFGQAIRCVHKHGWKRIWWPDYAAGWYFPATRQALRLLRAAPCDLLITSSHPFTGHLVGMRVRRTYRWLPWLVDVGDPLCFVDKGPSNNVALYGRLNRRAEQKVLEAATVVSVTNGVMEYIYAQAFPAVAHKIYVVPPLLRCESTGQTLARVFSGADRVRLVFVGRLYEGIRTPAHVLSTFASLLHTPLGDRLELHFFGWITGCERYFDAYRTLVGRKLFLHGPVDHSTARRAMAEASFLVNIGNTTPCQLPSKLVEYVHAGRPILNFASSPADSSILFLQNAPASLSLLPLHHDAANRQSEQLLRFLQCPLPIDQDRLQEWLQPFTTKHIAARYEVLTNELGRRFGPSPSGSGGTPLREAA